MNSKQKILTAKNLDKTFDRGNRAVHAVKDVTICISEGERVYVHGPSGAGKSTLLDILGALSRPTKGNVVFKGRDMYGLSDRERSFLRNREFGFIFQFYHLLPELDVLENVVLPGSIMGGKRKKEIKSRAVYLLERVKLGHRLTHKPSRLSGGELQRAAIARALINSPDILFCDEPAGNLDSEMSKVIYDLIFEISCEDGMGVLVVSHQGVGENFFHSEYIMKDGFLREEDRVQRTGIIG